MEPPAQIAVAPPGVTVGAAGGVLTVTLVGVLDALKHPAAFVI